MLRASTPSSTVPLHHCAVLRALKSENSVRQGRWVPAADGSQEHGLTSRGMTEASGYMTLYTYTT